MKLGKYFLILLAAATNAQAQEAGTVNATAAVPFLRVSPDARTGAMGDAGIAMLPDANAAFLNSARLPFAKAASAVGITYSPWMKDVNGEMFLASLAGHHRLKSGGTLSAGLRYFNMGNIDQYDYSGTFMQSSSPREFAIDLGYSRKIAGQWGVGITFRYINSRLINGSVGTTVFKTGSAVAADLSVFYHGVNEKGAGWTWGAALTNLGSRISYSNNSGEKDLLPAKLGTGAAYHIVFNEDNRLALTLDLNKYLVPAVAADSASVAKYRDRSVMGSWLQSFSDYDRFGVSTGAEYTYNDMFSLRAGYFMETRKEGGRKYFTAGAGLQYADFTLNFSYLAPFSDELARNPISNTLRFGLNYHIKP